ncbi:MAG: hypothetical protein GX434_05850 [Peptococcaceae bacterium]|nr:hypothetical protein [Peptococcaceae bacterium]
MVLSVVVLALFQISTVTDPVSFYLKIAGEIDSPAFKYDQYINTADEQGKKTITLYFTVNPESSVIVKQNENVVGIIKNETKMNVEPGTVQLDARHIHQPVTVDIIVNDKKHSIQLNGNIKSFDVQLRSSSAS